jgi:predicted dehydrogenase
MPFDPAFLDQSWPVPSNPRPVVTFGAGSVVGDAHFPAYAKSGIPIAGVYDPDQAKAAQLAAE